MTNRSPAPAQRSTLICRLLGILASAIPNACCASTPNDWYTRYPVYPPYCSTPAEMEKRAIPQVDDDVRLGNSRLIHTSVVIRHGARTPWTSLDCWEGYPVQWDCNLTTYIATPPPQRIQQEETQVTADGQQESTIWFEKRYDALQDSGDALSNILNGTCQKGQLILQGYEQELRNGRFLRDAYVFDSTSAHNERMKLLDTSLPMDAIVKQLYYRVDDDQRTIMSGQIVLRGMLGPELNRGGQQAAVIPLHTADRPMDIMDPNEKTCDRLLEMRERYEHGSEFQTFLQANETKLLESFWNDMLGRQLNSTNNEIIDCLMTTMCTDRSLPDLLNDYDGSHTGTDSLEHETANVTDSNIPEDDGESIYGSHLFERLYLHGTTPYAMLYQANNAEYARAGMAPLWAEIMSHIYAVTHEPTNDCCPPLPGDGVPARLALFSAHDTTIMPLLASLGPGVWDGEWAPYASMIALEIHELEPTTADKTLYRSKYAFRLVYNGKELTNRIDGCSADSQLCDVQLLFDIVRPFATRHTNCDRKFPPTVMHEDTVSRVKVIVSTPEGIAAVVVVLLGSFLAGVASACFCVRRSQRPRRPKRRIKVATEEEDQGGIALTEQSHHDHNGRVVHHEATGDEELRGSNGFEDEPASHENFTID